MSKTWQMQIDASELTAATGAGLDTYIALNPAAFTEGTQIKIIAGVDAAGDPVAGNDASIFIVLSDKTVGTLTFV